MVAAYRGICQHGRARPHAFRRSRTPGFCSDSIIIILPLRSRAMAAIDRAPPAGVSRWWQTDVDRSQAVRVNALKSRTLPQTTVQPESRRPPRRCRMFRWGYFWRSKFPASLHMRSVMDLRSSALDLPGLVWNMCVVLQIELFQQHLGVERYFLVTLTSTMSYSAFMSSDA